MKYVYLYRITLTKETETLYYIGMRICKCEPYQDYYMGSPKKYRKFWNDDTYAKTKEILKVGNYDTDYDNFRNEEVELIKEAWNQYGFFEETGKCLNAGAGKAIHPHLLSGKNSPMKRQEVKDKIMATRRAKYGETTLSEKSRNKLREYSNRPDIKEKSRLRLAKWREDNPERWEEIKKNRADKYRGENSPNKRPEVREKLSKAAKERYNGGGMDYLFSSETREKAIDSLRQTYVKNPSLRQKASVAAKERFEKDPSIKLKMSEARKKWYRDNPEKAKLKNKKSAMTRYRKSGASLEDFFA